MTEQDKIENTIKVLNYLGLDKPQTTEEQLFQELIMCGNSHPCTFSIHQTEKAYSQT